MSTIDDIINFISGGSESNTVVSNKDQNTQRGDGIFSTSGMWNSLISAGTSLAAIYFKQTGDKKLAEEAAKQRMKELEYAASLKGKGGGGGGGGGGNSAKMGALASLYQNYAALTQEGGKLESQRAIDTGQLMQTPINTRAAKL